MYIYLALLVLMCYCAYLTDRLVWMKRELFATQKHHRCVSDEMSSSIREFRNSITFVSDARANQLSLLQKRIELLEANFSVPRSNWNVAQWVVFFKDKIGHYRRDVRWDVLTHWLLNKRSKYRDNAVAKEALKVLRSEYQIKK